MSVTGTMTHRERTLAVLRYQSYDRLPIVHFGFLYETLEKWAHEGHFSLDEIKGAWDANPGETTLASRLGFDFNWRTVFSPNWTLQPMFDTQVIAEFPDGSQHIRNGFGVTILQKPDAGSIPAEIGHLLKDRESWEEHYKPRMQFTPERVTTGYVPRVTEPAIPFTPDGLALLQSDTREYPLGLEAGSLYGRIRDMIGIEELCYLQVDDEELFIEIIDTTAELCYQCVKYTLETGAHFDFMHFWEDIAYKNGPLVNPSLFYEKVGPHYQRITELAARFGLDIVSLDCDGCIDALIPTWIDNGVNTMFPIEVGTWAAQIAPWREKYGTVLRGVGGMNKRVFSTDRAGVDAEIERLRRLIDLGGYIPCPDHRIAGDAEWDLVRYYCDQMRAIFG